MLRAEPALASLLIRSSLAALHHHFVAAGCLPLVWTAREEAPGGFTGSWNKRIYILAAWHSHDNLRLHHLLLLMHLHLLLLLLHLHLLHLLLHLHLLQLELLRL